MGSKTTMADVRFSHQVIPSLALRACIDALDWRENRLHKCADLGSKSARKRNGKVAEMRWFFAEMR